MKLTPTKVLHYGLLLVAAYIVYSWLTKEGGRDPYDNHPRNKDKFREDDVKDSGHRYADDVRHVRNEDEDEVVNRQSKYEKDKKPSHNGKQRQQNEYEEDMDNDNREKSQSKNVPRRETKDSDRQKMESGPKIGKKDVVKDKVAIDKVDKERERGDSQHKSADKDKDSGDKDDSFKLKLKGKEEEGVDLLKKINDADLEGDPEVHKQIDQLSDHVNMKIPKLKKAWHENHDDIDVAAEKVRRRKEFFEKVRKLEAEEEMDEDKHIYESENDFPFVTAAYSENFKSALTFIHSVQINNEHAPIGIMDIGLTKEEVEYLETICNVEVVENFLPLYPKFVAENMAQKLWRPFILQIALNKYGHYVYVDINRYLKRGADLRGHFDLSRKGGAAIFGKVKGYSTYVVTNPEMYYYLAISVNKMLKMQHVEMNMMIMHNSPHIRHFFTRWLITCAKEKYCIAPPGSKRKCDRHLYPKSRYYADCHRYDESAINLLLASWHKYDFDHYAAADYMTKHYDGRDATPYLKFCPKKVKEGL